MFKEFFNKRIVPLIEKDNQFEKREKIYTLYHATLLNNEKSILENGLDPQKCKSSGGGGKRLWLSGDKSLAIYYARTMNFDSRKKKIPTFVEISLIPFRCTRNEVYIDEGESWNYHVKDDEQKIFVTYRPIEPEKIDRGKIEHYIIQRDENDNYNTERIE